MASELGWGNRKRRAEAAAAVRALRQEFSTPEPATKAVEAAAAAAPVAAA
jgi:hypothetical protein